MKRIPRRIFTKESKRETIKLVTEQHLNIAAAGRQLDVDLKSTRAWSEMPLAKQKQVFSEDLQVIFTEFEARIAKKKLNYKVKQATTDAMQTVNNWLYT